MGLGEMRGEFGWEGDWVLFVYIFVTEYSVDGWNSIVFFSTVLVVTELWFLAWMGFVAVSMVE